MYIVVVAIIPVSGWLTSRTGSASRAWQTIAVVVAVLMIGFQLFTIFGVREDRSELKREEHTGFRELVRALFRNDQLLMLVFLQDTVEYGEWKLGRRNESITLSLQPFINKAGSAAASAILGWTLIRSGINSARVPADVPQAGLDLVEVQMFLVPLACIVLSYIIWRLTYKITPEFYQEILTDLDERNEV